METSKIETTETKEISVNRINIADKLLSLKEFIKKLLKAIFSDKLFIALSLLYAILPIVIFGFGWTRTFIGLIAAIILIGFGVAAHISITREDIRLFTKDNIMYWAVTAFIAFLWVYATGIGGNAFQNSDFWVRNPIYRDLATYKWPVIYDLDQQSDLVRLVLNSWSGDDKVAFAYYFTWWLPAAFISKCLQLGNVGRNIVLILWAYLGVMLIMYLINRSVKKCSYIVPAVMMFFSGLDVIPFYVNYGRLPITDHIEWWGKYFQYSSNTTLLFWVFNQAIPVWIIVALLLQLKDNKYVAGLCSMAFAYSPWATFGIVPMAIAGSFRKGEKLKSIFNPFNILAPLVMLILYGSFYMASNGSDGGFKFIFAENDGHWRHLMYVYLFFLLYEFGVYFIALGKEAVKNKYYFIVLIELILFPLFQIRDFNFVIRGTIPALFMLSFFVTKYLVENWAEEKEKLRRRAVIIILVIGSFTALGEMNRSFNRTTMNEENMLSEDVISFGDMQTTDEYYIRTASDQFFIYDYEDSFFFKYLAK